MKTLVSDTEFADWIEGKIEFKHFKNHNLIEKRRKQHQQKEANQRALIAAVTNGATLEEFRRENRIGILLLYSTLSGISSGTNHARISRTTCPCTSVRRNSRP